MNANQLINMILRRVMRRLINRGVDAGIDMASRRGKGREAPMTPEDRARAKAMKETAKKARRAARITRRF